MPSTAWTDLFSLGVVLYEALTGKRPFERSNLMAILRAIGSDTPKSPRELDERIPQDVSDLVMRLLEKAPDDRFQTAAELVEAIRVIEETPAASVTLPASDKTPPRRGTLVAVAAVAALVLLAGIVVIVRDKDGKIIAKIVGDSVEVIDDDTDKSHDKSESLGKSSVNSSRDQFGAMGPLAMVQRTAKLESKDGESVNAWTLDALPIMGATAAAVSPDGKHVATFSDDGMVRIWDSQSRELVQFIVGHTAGPLRSGGSIATDGLSWNPDNRRLAAVDESGELRVWDTENGKVLSSYRHDKGKIEAFRWSPNGSLLAVRFDDEFARVLDSQAKVVSELEHPFSPWQLAWSPNSKTLAICLHPNLDRFLYLWDISTGKRQRLKCPAAIRGGGGSSVICWSPDGKQVAACCDNQVVVCDVKSGDVQPVLDEQAHVVAWSMDGSELLVERKTGREPDDGHQLVRIKSGAETKRIELIKNKDVGSVLATSLTPLTDGRHMLLQFSPSGSRLVDIETGESRSIGGRTAYSMVNLSADGFIGVNWNPAWGAWVYVTADAVENEEARWSGLAAGFPARVNDVACSETLLAICSGTHFGTIVFVDRRSGHVDRFSTSKQAIHGRLIEIAPDERSVFVANGQPGSYKCSTVSHKTGEEIVLLETQLDDGFRIIPESAQYSPDGSRIALAGHGISIHDAADGKRLVAKVTTADAPAFSVSWSADGKMIAVAMLRPFPSVQILDAQTLHKHATLTEFPQSGKSIGHLTWSPDGEYLAVTGDWGSPGKDPDPLWVNQLVVWETSEWKAVFTRPVTATALRFADDATLVYATRDGRVTYENVETGKELRSVQAGAGGQLTTFTPDGKQVLQVNGDRVSVRRLDEGTLQATIIPNLGDVPPPLSRVPQPVSIQTGPAGENRRALGVSCTYRGICERWRRRSRSNRGTHPLPNSAPKVSNRTKSLEIA